MSAKLPFTKADFDSQRDALADRLRDWAEEELASFDDAVAGNTGAAKGADDPSIWDDMPAIDSKRAIGALVEIEELIGCKLPVTLVRHGGYESVEDMIADLLPKVREKCVDPISDAAHTSASHLRTTSPGGVHAHL